MDELIKLLTNSNIKLVSRETGIPYARMHKWTKGGGKPKIDDFNILTEYFRNIKIDKSKYVDNQNRPDTTKSFETQLSQIRSEFLEKEKMYRELIAEKDKRLAEKDELIKVLKEQIAAKTQEKHTDPSIRTIPK